jgi:hypothetical protein
MTPANAAQVGAGKDLPIEIKHRYPVRTVDGSRVAIVLACWFLSGLGLHVADGAR